MATTKDYLDYVLERLPEPEAARCRKMFGEYMVYLNDRPVLLVCDAMIDGIWPMGAEGRHTRVRLRQGNDTLFASIFGVAPSTFAYPVGTAVEAALEVSIFTGRSGPMVSAHLRAIRPAGLGNLPSEQAAWFEAFRTGGTLLFPSVR